MLFDYKTHPRQASVEALLDTYRDVQTDERGAGVTTIADDRLLLRHPDFHQGSYKELEQALAKLKDHSPNQYQHLRAYFLTNEWSTKDVQVKRKSKKGIVTLTERQRFRNEPSWCRKQKVRSAIQWLTFTMQTVQLPRELFQQVAA